MTLLELAAASVSEGERDWAWTTVFEGISHLRSLGLEVEVLRNFDAFAVVRVTGWPEGPRDMLIDPLNLLADRLQGGMLN